jgi:DNA-binding transcriptional LysR family regulator
MVAEANAAYERVACARARPAGLIRMSCPAIVAQMLIGPLIPQFAEKNPEVRIGIEATSRKVDMEENFDLSVRIQQVPSQDSGMIMRSLGIVQQVLVASPSFLRRNKKPETPSDAARLATIGHGSFQGPHIWKLVDSDEKELQIRHEPKFISDDMVLVRQAAVQGVGIAQIPLAVCLNEVRQGELELVLPELRAPLFEIQVVYPSRRGMLPAVRSFIDFLSAHCVSEVAERQIKRHIGGGPRESATFWTSRQPLHQVIGRSAPRQVRVA